jgi:cbb3-type cytochrome oxidase subunit 3
LEGFFRLPEAAYFLFAVFFFEAFFVDFFAAFFTVFFAAFFLVAIVFRFAPRDKNNFAEKRVRHYLLKFSVSKKFFKFFQAPLRP